MRLSSISVSNYRSIVEETLFIDDLTALVGANGCGKSNFLKALDLFYSAESHASIEDFYDRNASLEVCIRVTFSDLQDEAKKLFQPYFRDGHLVVERVFRCINEKIISAYHGNRLGNPAFSNFHNATSAKEKKEVYQGLQNTDYTTLPKWKNADEALENLKAWETQHSEKCSLIRDDGQFFGFKEVAVGYLGRFTRFLFIPAIRDASEESSDGKNTIMSQLMDIVVRRALAESSEIRSLQEEMQKKLKDLVTPAKIPGLGTLADQMTKTLQTYVPTASVELTWNEPGEIKIPVPTAEVRLVEDGFRCSVERTGHGLQRAFVLTMLQQLTTTKPSEKPLADNDEKSEPITLPNLVLVIEEPELYQHPSRQRHFSQVLRNLAKNSLPGVALSAQVVFCSHSPLFVGIDRASNVRLLRKVIGEEKKPKISKLVSVSLDIIAERIWIANGSPGEKYTATSIHPRLLPVMTPIVNEGFFADKIILVEGESDRAMLIAYAGQLGINLDRQGIAVIPVGGKTNLDRPYTVFDHLGIPTFMIWDGDHGDKDANPEDNIRLLRLLGVTELSEWPEGVADKYAVFKVDLETKLKADFGEHVFNEGLQNACQHLGFGKQKDGLKNAMVIDKIIGHAKANGKKSDQIELIFQKVLAL